MMLLADINVCNLLLAGINKYNLLLAVIYECYLGNYLPLDDIHGYNLLWI